MRKKPGRKAEPPTKGGIAWPRWTGFRGKTVWDWLQVLIVPFALVVIGFVFTMQQDARQQQIEEQRVESERELEVQRAQDAALQAYLDQMSHLLLEKDLRNSEEDSEVRTLARARTLTVLGTLDASRRTAVIEFLAEAELLQGGDERAPIVSLYDADLSGADLSGTDLNDARLGLADLSGADLFGLDLRGANLSGADLSGADVRFAELNDADLRDADLRDADLGLADLEGARGPNNEQLEQQAKSLDNATMPNGQKYEDWLKSKGSEEGS